MLEYFLYNTEWTFLKIAFKMSLKVKGISYRTTLNHSTGLFPNMRSFLWPQCVTGFVSVEQIKRWGYWQYKGFVQGQPVCHCGDKTELGCIPPAPGLCSHFENFPIILGKQST